MGKQITCIILGIIFIIGIISLILASLAFSKDGNGEEFFKDDSPKYSSSKVTEKLINHIKKSLKKTDRYESKITEDILKLDGMSGKKTRHFYNNICSMDDARYLEIGTWKGSSICSAMCNNNIKTLAIDNWSEFGGPKEEFLKNFDKFKGVNDATFLEKNCWDIDSNKIGKFNIYMYDGNHTTDSHFKALNNFLPALDNVFIYLVDDWNKSDVREGTLNAIKKNKLKISYKKEIRTTNDNSHANPWGVASDWHNGICIFVLKKL